MIYLNEDFKYDSEAGELWHNRDKGGGAKKGDIAGYKENHGYLSVTWNGKAILVHRLIWRIVYGFFPNNEIDHINHNKLDNRLKNLRTVNKQEQLKNQSKYKNNKTGITGVHWDKEREKWRAQIGINGKCVRLGTYNDFFEACCDRKAAERKLNYHPNHG